jgi:hypothetical protein
MKNRYWLLVGVSLLLSACAGGLQTSKVIDDVYFIPSTPNGQKAYTTLLQRSNVVQNQRAVKKDTAGNVEYFDENLARQNNGTAYSRSYTENPNTYNSALYPQYGMSYGMAYGMNNYYSPYSSGMYNPYDPFCSYNRSYYSPYSSSYTTGYGYYPSYSPYSYSTYPTYYGSNYSGSNTGNVKPMPKSNYTYDASSARRTTYGRRVSMNSDQVVVRSNPNAGISNQRKSTSVSSFTRPASNSTNYSNSTNTTGTTNYSRSSYSGSSSQSGYRPSSVSVSNGSSSSSSSSSGTSSRSSSSSSGSSSSGGGSRSGGGRR